MPEPPAKKPTGGIYDDATPQHAWPRPWMGDFLAALAKYPTGTGRANIRRACREAGVSDTHVHNVRKADPVFADAFDEAKRAAKETAHESLNDLLFGWASTGMPVREVTVTKNEKGEVIDERVKTSTVRSPTVAIFLAKKWMPEVYGDAPIRVENTGADGGPILVRSLSTIDDEIVALTAELAANDPAG